MDNTGAGVLLGQNLTVTSQLTLSTDLTTTSSYTLNLGGVLLGFGAVAGLARRR